MTIEELDALIKAANEEIENCKRLKKELAALSEDAINCAALLESIHSSLSKGLSADEFAAGINNVKERANCMINFNSKVNIVSANVDSRIVQLDEYILSWEAEKEDLSRKWWEWFSKENSSEESEKE